MSEVADLRHYERIDDVRGYVAPDGVFEYARLAGQPCPHCGKPLVNVSRYQDDADWFPYCPACERRSDYLYPAPAQADASGEPILAIIEAALDHGEKTYLAIQGLGIEGAAGIHELFCQALEELAALREREEKGRDAAIEEFRADELDAVMHSVDKWFDEGDPRLKNNPATRAADAREIALQAIESAEARAALGKE